MPYVNVLPLLDGLDAVFPADRWLRETPRELGTALAESRIDVAMLSSIEGLRHGYRHVPGAMIGSDGAVRSVALHAKVPLAEIRTVLLDRASLSSVALCRVLAAELLRIEPVYTTASAPFAADFDWSASPHDAFLAIGDTALAWEHRFPHRLDLGEGWKRLTGLPFVFALWWVREGVTMSAREVAVFAEARSRGRSRIPALVDALGADALAPLGGRESVIQYLTHAIRHDFGADERRSLSLFREKLVARGILPAATRPLTAMEPVG